MHIQPLIWVEWAVTKPSESLQNQFYSPVSFRNGTFFIPQHLFKLVKSLFLEPVNYLLKQTISHAPFLLVFAHPFGG